MLASSSGDGWHRGKFREIMAINWTAVKRSLAKHLATADELRAKFKDAHLLKDSIGKAAWMRVARWEWYSGGTFELDPTSFILSWNDKPGRPLKGKPSRLCGAVQYGFDGQGKVALARTFWSEKPQEEFWEHQADRLSTMRFDEAGRTQNTQLLLLEKDRPMVLLMIGSAGTHVKFFEHRDTRIVKVLEAQKGYSEFHPQDEPWSFSVHRLSHKPSGEVEAVTYYDDGGKDVRHYKPPKFKKVV
jgi:hypothetical protein